MSEHDTSPATPEYALSIVICTHRRFELLDGAVASLADQEPVDWPFEVLVVDNDTQPNAQVQAVVERYRPMLDIRYVHEQRLGLSHARNAGGQASRADYIAYLDDDAKAPPGFLKAVLRNLVDKQPHIFGGPYYPFYLDQKPAWFRDEYGTGSHGQAARCLTNNEFLSGGNIVIRRDLLEELDWFDPSYGMNGGSMWYGEETVLQMRARERDANLTVYFDPDAYVLHLVPARKMKVRYHLLRAYKVGRSQAHLWMAEDERNVAKRRALRRIAGIVPRLAYDAAVGMWLRNRTRYPYWQNYYCESVSRWFSRLGHSVTLLGHRDRRQMPVHHKADRRTRQECQAAER